jgi:16S rRNA (adenine1518-N6/adenine1519-N6)-dimethyltransferase
MSVDAKRSLGQNFLVAQTVIARILETARFMAAQSQGIVEVGPGRGALTAGLVALGKPYWAVELDDDLAAQTAERFPGIRVSTSDARSFDWLSLGRTTGLHPWFLVANLPYNAGTEILHQALFRREVLSGALVMLQREVARKFCAHRGEEGYGPHAIWVDLWWEQRLLFTVPPGAFRPQPKVTSAVCAFTQRPDISLPTSAMQEFWDFCRGAFRQPRKTLLVNLDRETMPDRGAWAILMNDLGLSPNLRPAQVTPEAFARLFAAARSG